MVVRLERLPDADRGAMPLVAFHVAHPGFQALFSGSLVSLRLAAAVEAFLNAVVGRAQALLALHAPGLSLAIDGSIPYG
jgi:hypothetical protein